MSDASARTNLAAYGSGRRGPILCAIGTAFALLSASRVPVLCVPLDVAGAGPASEVASEIASEVAREIALPVEGS